MGHREAGVVIKCIGGEEELGALHLNIVVEYRHLCLGVVLAPVGGERGLAVNHLSALEEVGVVVKTVEVETIGIKRGLFVLKHHVIAGAGHLLVAIVIGIIAEQREGVALIHLYMAESLERVAGLVEVGTIAIKAGSLVGKMHLAIEYGGIGILGLVVVQHIGMNQINAGVLRLLSLTRSRTTALLLLCKSRHQSQRKGKKQYVNERLSHSSLLTPHFTQPSYSNLQSLNSSLRRV